MVWRLRATCKQRAKFYLLRLNKGYPMKLPKAYFAFALLLCSSLVQAETPTAMDYLADIAGENGIGARFAGSESSRKTAQYIEQQWINQGYSPYTMDFDINAETESKNIMLDIAGKSHKTLIIAAHYDSTGVEEGSLGATDNGSSIAALLALSHNLRNQNLALNVRLIAFGAEEIGLLGSKAYVAQLTTEQRSDLVGMINLDTIVGGDKLYIHSAHTKPYKCPPGSKSFNSDTTLRDALLKQAQLTFTPSPFALHPSFPEYPEGATGGWSDHAPFACAGVPIAYIEATNFSINGKEGFDGYSQSTNPALWDCFSEKKATACDRDKEKKWGEIWHTESDQLDKLLPIFGQRIETQLEQTIQLLTDFVEAYQTAS